MEVVVDSNILFSALISGRSVYLDVFRVVQVYAPDFIFLEISKYEQKIIKKTALQDSFREFTRNLFSQIQVIPNLSIAPESFAFAYDLCRDIDEEDTPFLALSIELSIPLWTNDKVLVNGLRTKGYSNLIDSEEIFKLLD